MNVAKSARMRLWEAGTRIMCLLAVMMPFAAFARTIVVPAQPVSPYADTEVYTNVVIQTGRTDVRDVKIRLQLDGTPTNNFEIAFGCDANTNGVLDVWEIETVYGWRAGRYFVENVRAWERIEAETAVNALCGVLDVHLETRPGLHAEAFHGHVRRRDGLCRPFHHASPGVALQKPLEHGARRPARRWNAVRVGSVRRAPQFLRYQGEVTFCCLNG